MDEPSFLLALLRDFGNDDLRLVYADWLEEQGGATSAAKADYLRSLARSPDRSAAGHPDPPGAVPRGWASTVSRFPLGTPPRNASPRDDGPRDDLRRLLRELCHTDGVADTCTEIGRLYLKLREFEAAEAWHRQALAADPADPWAHLYLGNLAYSRRQHGQALDWFERARELLPDLAIAYLCIADAHDALGRPEQALKYLRLAAAVEPDADGVRERLDAWYQRNYNP